MKKPPLGITILGTIGLLWAINSILKGFGAIAVGGLVGSVTSAAFGEAVVTSGTLAVVSGILHGIIALGLLLLRRWAWTLTIILYVFSTLLLFIAEGISLVSLVTAPIVIVALIYLYFKKDSFE